MATNMITQLHVLIPDDKELVVSSKKKEYSSTPSFVMFGAGTLRGEVMSVDIVDTMADWSKPEHWFFRLVRRGYDNNTGISTIDTTNWTQVYRNRQSNAYAGLRDRGILLRVRNNTYIINPVGLIHPKKNIRDNLYNLWIQLGGII